MEEKSEQLVKDLALWMWGKRSEDAAKLIKQAFVFLGHEEEGALISCKLIAAALLDLE